MAQSATQKRTPLGIEPFWKKPSADRSSIEVGEMAEAGKIGSSCEGKHCFRHFARTKARKCSTTVRTNLREHNNRFLSSFGMRKISKKRATENELGKIDA